MLQMARRLQTLLPVASMATPMRTAIERTDGAIESVPTREAAQHTCRGRFSSTPSGTSSV